jgi:hypothetical protein
VSNPAVVPGLRPSQNGFMSEREKRALAETWARWKKRVADGWGPVSAWVVKDIEPPPRPPKPKPASYSSRERTSR